MNADSKEPDIDTTTEVAELSPVERLRRSLVVAQQAGTVDPSPNKKIRIGKLLWAAIFLVLVAVGYLSYRYFEHRKTQELAKAIENQSILDMASRHNAAGDFRARLDEIEEPTLTHVRATLSRTDGRPLSMSLYVRDITSTDNNNVHFAEFGSQDPEIDFVLECTAEQIARLKQQTTTDDSAEFAVIAMIISVEQSGDPEDSAFVAKGRLLDYLVVNY